MTHAPSRPSSLLRAVLALGATALLASAPPLEAQRGGFRGRVTIGEGEQCPPGTTEIRPRTCMAPQVAPPSIVDYRPESTLKVPVHEVPRAKYPAIDFHGHPRRLVRSVEGLRELERTMDALNLGTMIVAENVSGAQLTRLLTVVDSYPPMKDRVAVLTGISFRGVGEPGWVERTIAQLEADAKAGAVGVGEISKAFGLTVRKPDGSRLRLDDPLLAPVWEACGRLGLPVFIHTGDPAEFFEPFDTTNERWLEQALFPNRRYPPERYPSFAQLVAERDALFKRHPNTTFVTAHLGWQANDLATLGALFDAMPNVYSEMGAVLYDIGRQPRAARDFFLRYQDRILFGKDSFQPGEYPYYWRVLETADDYFDYYRGYHAFWKLYGIDLPDEVLKKVYYGNALRLMPSLSRDRFPR